MIANQNALTGSFKAEPNFAALSDNLDALQRHDTPFELGFRAGRTEGLLSLVEAVTTALTPEELVAGPVIMTAAEAPIAEPVHIKIRPCILVVDDDPFTFDLLEDLFQADFDVISADNGLSALDLAAGGMPDVILLDVMMPGMNGYEVCRQLKAQPETANIPVMFITGQGDVAAETRGIDAGAVDYITKPINPAPVSSRVRNQIKLKWALDKLAQVSGLEQVLREELLEALEAKESALFE